MKSHAPHLGASVAVGQYTVLAGGLQYLRSESLWPGDVLVPLTDESLPTGAADGKIVAPLYLPDFGGVPSNWETALDNMVEILSDGASLMVFCIAGHGRTGTFLASLIAILEDEEVTPDPIAAVRERHCERAVESVAQGEAIFALRGQKLPRSYRSTLWTPSPRKERTARKRRK